MNDGKNRVCPAEMSGSLDNRLRRWVQNPRKILGPYLNEGMTVLDYGCGPGFFTLDMAKMVGRSGRVIAVDLQEAMLRKLRQKIDASGLEKRITLQRCDAQTINLSETVDFALAFYVVHEHPAPSVFFAELASIVRPGGQALIVEPPFHVSASAFRKTVACARDAGFKTERGPAVFLSRTVMLKKEG